VRLHDKKCTHNEMQQKCALQKCMHH
jgi:hypothetical protein